MQNRLKGVFQEKCPICGKGEVFETKGNVLLMKMPQMHEACTHCHHRYEIEPGYFMGAMYVSYGLNIAEMVAVLLVCLVIGVSLDYILYLAIFTVLLLWGFNFRMSRVIWMYLFNKG